MGARWPHRRAWPTAACRWLAVVARLASGPGRWTSTTPGPRLTRLPAVFSLRQVPTPTGLRRPPSSRPAMAAWAGVWNPNCSPWRATPAAPRALLAAGGGSACCPCRASVALQAPPPARRGGRWSAQPRRLRQLLRAAGGLDRWLLTPCPRLRARRYWPSRLARGAGSGFVAGRPAFCHHRLGQMRAWQPGRADDLRTCNPTETVPRWLVPRDAAGSTTTACSRLVWPPRPATGASRATSPVHARGQRGSSPRPAAVGHALTSPAWSAQPPAGRA